MKNWYQILCVSFKELFKPKKMVFNFFNILFSSRDNRV